MKDGILPAANYSLVITARRGSAEGAGVTLDDITVKATPKMTVEIAKELDEKANNNGTTTTTPPPTTTEEPGEGEEEEEVDEAGMRTSEIGKI